MKNTSVDAKAVEVSEEVKAPEIAKTKVKVRFTVIMFYKDETKSVETLRLIGKMGSTECKKHVQESNKANVLISKCYEDEEIEVDTLALYALKSV